MAYRTSPYTVSVDKNMRCIKKAWSLDLRSHGKEDKVHP